MSPVGTIFVPFPPKTGTNMLHPLPHPIVELVCGAKTVSLTVEMCTLTAAGGLLHAGAASSVTRTNFHQPPLWFCPTEDINLGTSYQYATTYSIV